MAETWDVIIIGARCAGSPLAALLARAGLKVALVERAAFPRDTLSTHIFQGPGINFLDRLGVLDRVEASGARALTKADIRLEDERYHLEVPQRPGDHGAFMSVRRFVLDPILADAAREAGAKVMMSANVTGLVTEGGRVQGVKVTHRGRERELLARLVVGADGRNSTVAELVGSRKYNVTPNHRFGYWAFFAGAGRPEELVYHRWDGRFVIATPCDEGLYQVIQLHDLRFLPEFKRDREAAFMAHARACEPVAELIEGARRVGKMFGMLKFEGFFREASGAGWALVGDAGHFKDPAPGWGISDAFRQAEALAPVIARTIGQPDAIRDAALAAWGRWRDEDAQEHYWLAVDFGAGGRMPSVAREITRRLYESGHGELIAQVFQHRVKPSAVFTPGRLAAATARLAARSGADRGQVIQEAREAMATELRRRTLARKPEFVDTSSHRDAGETEVSAEVAA